MGGKLKSSGFDLPAKKEDKDYKGRGVLSLILGGIFFLTFLYLVFIAEEVLGERFGQDKAIQITIVFLFAAVVCFFAGVRFFQLYNRMLRR